MPKKPSPESPATKTPAENLLAIQAHLDTLETYLGDYDLQESAVSEWSVGQHIEHILAATSLLTVLLLRNRTLEDEGDQRSIKPTLLNRGRIPRGIAQAPEATVPGDSPALDDLEKQLRACRKRVARLPNAESESVVTHPYLGDMNRDEALAFMVIHLDHHLKIMADIMKDAK